MYRILSLGDGEYPKRDWIIGDTLTDGEFERALRLFLTWRNRGERLALLWVPDDERDRELPPLPAA